MANDYKTSFEEEEKVFSGLVKSNTKNSQLLETLDREMYAF